MNKHFAKFRCAVKHCRRITTRVTKLYPETNILNLLRTKASRSSCGWMSIFVFSPFSLEMKMIADWLYSSLPSFKAVGLYYIFLFLCIAKQ